MCHSVLCKYGVGVGYISNSSEPDEDREVKKSSSQGIVTGIFQYLVSCAVFYRFFCDTDFLFNHTRQQQRQRVAQSVLVPRQPPSVHHNIFMSKVYAKQFTGKWSSNGMTNPRSRFSPPECAHDRFSGLRLFS